MVKNLPANAGDMGSTPGFRKTLTHVPQLPSPHTREPVLNKREAHAAAAREQPPLATTREKPGRQRPRTAMLNQ